MSLKKKAASLLITGCIVLSTVPAAAAVETVQSLQVGATSGTCGENVTWTLEDGTLTISGTGRMTDYDYTTYNPWDSNPADIKNVVIQSGVTSIGDMAFYGCSGLQSINIPDGVTSIGDMAFQGCSSLTNITIPNSVTSIGDMAFSDCSSLTSIEIPNRVTYIGAGAFSDCSGLTSIEIPNSVTSIGYSAFNGCINMSSISVSSGNNSFCSAGDVLFDINKTKLIFAAPKKISGKYDIPNSVTSIEGYAFGDCSSLTSIEIPNSVTSIGYSAFNGCSGLQSITIPNSVTSIGDYAFYGCDGLTSIEIPNSVTYIGVGAFFDCSSLTSIKIPNSITSIGMHEFCNCSSLTSIEIPNSVTSIGIYAFVGCSSLQSITIPDSVTSIADSVFIDCINMSSISVDSGNTHYCSDENVLFDINKKELIFAAPKGISGEYSIPNSVTSIGFRAFWCCDSLTSINIPDGVTLIAGQAFNGCINMSSISVSSGNNSFCSDKNVLFDRNKKELIFAAPKGISGEYSIPNSVTSIEYYAFSDCSSLQSITIPNSVTSIGIYAFSGCSSLQSINIPDGVTSIGNDLFNGCSRLTSITIPDGVTSIGVRAFEGCNSLTSINIPDSVTSIGDYAFAFSGLEKVYFKGNPPTINSAPFGLVEGSDSPSVIDAYYPKGNPNWTEDVRNNFGKMLRWHETDLENIGIEVKPATGQTDVDVKNIPPEQQNAVKAAAEKFSVNWDEISGDISISDSEKIAAINALRAENSGVTIEEADTITVYAETYLNIKPASYSKDSCILDITPMVRTIASTAESAKQINLEGKNINAIVYGEPKKLEVSEPVDMSIPLPDGFTVTNNTVYVQHKDYEYDAAVKNSVATFKNPHGFSTFKIASISQASARIGTDGTKYLELQKAVDAVQDNETIITVLKDSSATVNTEKTFKVKTEGQTVNIKAANGYSLKTSGPDENGITTYTVTKNASRPSGGTSTPTVYTPNITNSENGTATVNPQNPTAGTTVTITVKPNEGYKLTALTVTDVNGDAVEVTQNSDGTYTFKQPTGKVTITPVFAQIDMTDTKIFSDVPSNAYYADAVTWAVDKGVTSGTSATTFSPDNSCTRAEIMQMLWRAMGSPKASSTSGKFTDVKSGDYFYDAVQWAVSKGITSGTSATTFSPNATCTRAQAMAFLWIAKDKPVSSNTLSFTDVQSDDYFYNPVKWAVENDVTSGTSPTTFSPNQDCTRAQIVTFIYKAMA